jgi:cardiolipin synthase
MRVLAALALVAVLAGCATQPKVKLGADIRAAAPLATPAEALALMREAGERFAHVKFTQGNRATLLVDGPASFAALAAAINAANTRIDMESYEFDAQAGGQFSTLLINARRRGVAVHLIYDAWGTVDTPAAVFGRLRQAGVQVLEYNPLAPSARVPIDINDRDHRKLLCVDGRVAITGGVNISKVYENPPSAAPQTTPPDDEAWRDTDVRLEGPVAAEFERYYAQTWQRQNGPALPPPPPAPGPLPGGILVQAIDGAPIDRQPLIYRTLVAAIDLSKKSVHLTTGFFVPTPGLMDALQRAARRGVDVRIVVPGRSTSDAAVAAGRADYGALLESGVHIYELKRAILHAKTAVIDGAWSAVGSSNLDWRSTVWNNEIDAILLDYGFGAQMEDVFVADLRNSQEVTLAQWRGRGLGERLKEIRGKLLEKLL